VTLPFLLRGPLASPKDCHYKGGLEDALARGSVHRVLEQWLFPNEKSRA
jgi:hypothetical protein